MLRRAVRIKTLLHHLQHDITISLYISTESLKFYFNSTESPIAETMR
jgi:hypothetical protein